MCSSTIQSCRPVTYLGKTRASEREKEEAAGGKTKQDRQRDRETERQRERDTEIARAATSATAADQHRAAIVSWWGCTTVHDAVLAERLRFGVDIPSGVGVDASNVADEVHVPPVSYGGG